MKLIKDKKTGVSVFTSEDILGNPCISYTAPFDIEVSTAMQIIFSLLLAGQLSDRFDIEE